MMPSMPAVWRQALPLTVLLLSGLLLIYRDTVGAMVLQWSRSDNFAHAYLVPPIVLWLIWRQRAAVAAVSPRPQFWMLLPIAAMALLWLLGELVAMNAVTQLALTAIVVLLVPALLGFEAARVMMFPLAFLFFAVPIGDFMQQPMMDWTARITVLALQATGVPVFVEGNHLVVPSGRWAVVEACSGVRYLVASFMVGSLFAYLNYRSALRRWIFVGVSIVVPIVANWMRAYLIVMVGHLSDNKLGAGADHLIYGWAFFGIIIAIMFAIGARWSEPDPAPSSDAGRPDETPSTQGRGAYRAAVAPWLIAALAAGLVVAPHLVLRAIVGDESAQRPVLTLPESLSSDWVLAPGEPQWAPEFVNPAAQSQASYRQGTQQAGVFVAYYRNQNFESKLVSSENRLTRSEDWRWNRIANGGREFALAGGDLKLRTALFRGHAENGRPGQLDRTGKVLLVWQTYWVDGRWTTSDAWAKLFGALYRLAGRGDDAAAIVLHAVGDDESQLAAELEAFVRANWPALEATLERTRASRH